MQDLQQVGQYCHRFAVLPSIPPSKTEGYCCSMCGRFLEGTSLPEQQKPDCVRKLKFAGNKVYLTEILIFSKLEDLAKIVNCLVLTHFVPQSFTGSESVACFRFNLVLPCAFWNIFLGILFNLHVVTVDVKSNCLNVHLKAHFCSFSVLGSKTLHIDLSVSSQY